MSAATFGALNYDVHATRTFGISSARGRQRRHAAGRGCGRIGADRRRSGREAEIAAREKIALGHKIALAPIGEGEAITKFGVVIGIAMRRIEAGEWVHLHNCRSQLDERSGSFDVQTGAPGDNAYE